MIWIIIEMLFLSLLIVLPWALYYSVHPCMTKFYLKMVGSESARKLYLRCVLIILLMYHYVYAGGHPGEWGILLSTILCAMLFSFKRANKIMRKLYYNNRYRMIVALIAMAICAIPHLHTMAATLGFILLARMFYPSFSMMAEWNKYESMRKIWTDNPKEIPSYYFY